MRIPLTRAEISAVEPRICQLSRSSQTNRKQTPDFPRNSNRLLHLINLSKVIHGDGNFDPSHRRAFDVIISVYNKAKENRFCACGSVMRKYWERRWRKNFLRRSFDMLQRTNARI